MKKIDEEKIIKEVVENSQDSDRGDYDVNTYSDVHNDLGDNKPKYLDPIRQRSQ